MRALIRTPNGPTLAEVQECDITSPDEVKVKVHRAAICRTDLYVASGAIPTAGGRIMGHEAAGVVIDCGSNVSGDWNFGDRVVIDPLRPCGRCVDCRSGDHHHCAASVFMGIDYDGAFADYVVVPEAQLRVIPPALPFDLAVYTEPLAATRAVLQLSIDREEMLLIYGSGRIARLTEQILRSAGHENVTTSRTPGNNRYNTIIEAADSGEKIGRVLSALVSGGRLIIKSRHPESISLPLLEMIKKRIRLEAVYYSPFGAALDYLLEHQDFLAGLLGHCWTLDSYKEAFMEASSSESLKILLSLAD